MLFLLHTFLMKLCDFWAGWRCPCELLYFLLNHFRTRCPGEMVLKYVSASALGTEGFVWKFD